MQTSKILLITAAAVVGFALMRRAQASAGFYAGETIRPGGESTYAGQTSFNIFDVFNASSYYDVPAGSRQLQLLLEQDAGFY